MISEKIEKGFQQQLNRELYSAYLYLAMSAYFESVNLGGMAHWMRIQSSEEVKHAMKFYRHLVQRGGRVILSAIEAPPVKWKSPADAFESAYEHEREVSRMIHGLVELSRAGKDHASENFLQWFVEEQVEEEFSVYEILQKLKLIGDSGGGLMFLDHQLGERKEEET